MGSSFDDFMGEIYGRIAKDNQAGSRDPGLEVGNETICMQRMLDASTFGKITGSCGETMEIFLRIEGDHIVDASFRTDGCISSILCGLVASRLAKGKTVDDAAMIGGDTILMVLKRLPETESHCAYLAAETLHAAIHNWMIQ